MVTMVGYVTSPSDSPRDESAPRRFILETSVYNTARAAPVSFSTACFLDHSKRWQRVKTPPGGTLLSVTAKIAGRTADTNHLALRVLDFTYLPRPASAVVAPSSTATSPSQRSLRWHGRVAPSTPSKRPRIDEPCIEAKPVRGEGSVMHPSAADSRNPQRTEAAAESRHRTSSPSATPSPNLDNDSRRLRTRHPPKAPQD